MNLLRLISFILLALIAVPSMAQSDSNGVQRVDTVAGINDLPLSTAPDTTVSIVPIAQDSMSYRPPAYWLNWNLLPSVPFDLQILKQHPYYDFRSAPIAITSQLRIFRGKETLFYMMVGLLLIFALLKMAFAKYFQDLFRVFFRTTMKQRQIREQLMQTPLPSLLFNIFFVATTGFYINLIFQDYGFKPVDNFWLLYIYCCVGLAVIYMGKFIGLKVCGWLFNMKQAADSYIFIVFIINKVIGIFLMPVLVLLTFSEGAVHSSIMALSWCGIGGLLVYRFILGYGVIRNEVRFNLFHFFLYLCAFEVAPLLLIYRVLLFFFK